MAEIIPQYAVDASKSARLLHTHLTHILGAGYRVVQYLGLDSETTKPHNTLSTGHLEKRETDTPSADTESASPVHPLTRKPLRAGSLFWIQKGHQSLFIHVSHASARATRINRNQPQQLKQAIRNNPDMKQVLRIQKKLLPEPLYQHKASLTPFLVIFPELDENQIKLVIKSHGIQLGGKEMMEPVELLTFLRTHMGMPVSPTVFRHMRRQFNPETKLTAIPGDEDSAMLDFDQEFALKSEIHLPIDARRSANYNLWVLTGGAGSGKTQVLIHRASLLRKLNPQMSILILTHNEAIRQSIENQYRAFHGEDRKITIMSINHWCRRRLNIDERLVRLQDVTEQVDQVMKRQLQKVSISRTQFMREIAFIKGRLMFRESDYLSFNRSGQAVSLDNEAREAIWRALLTLDNELATQHKRLYNDIPKMLLQSTRRGKLLEHYDHILVDEAQYFSPVEFELIKKSLKPFKGQLYLTYDANQGFLNNRIHWQDTGLDLRGRSMRLLYNYRHNPNIMRAAQAFHLNRLPDESDDIIISSKHHDASRQPTVQGPDENSPLPKLLHFNSERDEQNRLLKEIHNRLSRSTENGARLLPHEILVLTPDEESANHLAAEIEHQLSIAVSNPALDDATSNTLRVCPLDSATGLESKAVFVTGIQQLFEAENDSELSDRERHTLVTDNTRKLYMGMTRAGDELTLMMTCDSIPNALLSPFLSVPTNDNSQIANIRYLHG